MPAADTVAKLNRIGGKASSTQRTRLRARVTDLFFPEKADQARSIGHSQNKRGSGQLSVRQRLRDRVSTGRRNSLSLPDEEEDNTPAPKPNPKTKVMLKKSRAADNDSPLKKHGLDLGVDKDPRVNLVDSPARNTRSKNLNPLEELRRAQLPIPESLDREDTIRNQPKKTPARPVVSIDGATSRKRAAEPDANLADGDGEGSRPSKTTKLNHNVIAVSHATSDNIVEEQSRDQLVDSPNVVVPNRKLGRSRKNAKESERVEEADAAPSQRSATRQEQRRQTTEQKKKELEKFREKYVQPIGDVVNIYDLAESWSNIGGGAFYIQAIAGPKKSQSVRGKSVDSVIGRLDQSYRALGSPSVAASQAEREVKKHLKQLESRCQRLDKTEDSQENRLIVGDMFMIIIPSIIMTLRRFLLARGKDGTLSLSAKRELVVLLDVAINTCDKARAWRPKLTALESGVRLCIKNDVLANLKQIKAPFNGEIGFHDRREREDRALRDLGKRSHAQHQELMAKYALERRMKLQRRWSRPAGSVDRGIPSKNMQQISDSDDDNLLGGTVYDVDDIGGLAAAIPSEMLEITGRKKVSSRTDGQGRNPHLQRESTADLPPPLSIDFSEEEKVALLNGLQSHQGRNRYNEILSDNAFGAVLGKRDLDDLVKAARSFSQMMASRMGVEAYQAEQSLSWLRSADPDA